MHIHNWFGIPAWVLTSERGLRQALEVYSGRQIAFEFFRAKTMKSTTVNGGFDDITYYRRSIQFEAIVRNSIEGFPRQVKGQFLLETQRKGRYWKISEPNSWMFETDMFEDRWTKFIVKPVVQSDIPTGGPFERIRVGKYERIPTNDKWYTGTGIQDRVGPT